MRATKAGTGEAYVERVNRAMDHVVQNLERPLRLGALARAALMSPFHFHRVFQALTGETPGEFVKRLRLERALDLMSRPGKRTLTQIALACGFASSSDFSRCFRQRFGVAPSRFDLEGWRERHRATLESLVAKAAPAMPGTTNLGGPQGVARLRALPARRNPDRFRVRVRALPARTVAYIRVANPYRTDGVPRAAERLMAWADRHGVGDGQWLGYQWENPEIVPLERCRYHVAVELPTGCRPSVGGEVGRFHFPPMLVAEMEMRGGVDLELRALQWFFAQWLPRSGYEPDDHPGFEAWVGRPFAHGYEYFELLLQVPVRRLGVRRR